MGNLHHNYIFKFTNPICTVGLPPLGIGNGVVCIVTRGAGKGGGLGVLIPGIAGSREMERQLSGGRNHS